MFEETLQITDNRRFNRLVLLLIAAGFLAVMLAGVITALVMIRSEDQQAWVRHSYDVERRVGGIRLSLEEMRSARRAHVIGIAVDRANSYASASARFFDAVGRVQKLTVDNPTQQRSIARLKEQAKALDVLFTTSLRPGYVRTVADEDVRQRAAGAVVQTTTAMLGEERRLLGLREAEQRRTVRIFYAMLAVAAALLALVGAGSIWIIRRYTSALTQSRNQLQELNANLEGAVAIRTVDLQRANDEIQRFAYIVSHDLRSPLVNVMGFTAEIESTLKPLSELMSTLEERQPELLTEAARLAIAEDLPESIGFIRSSTQKMDRLINAILRLSREGRRTITPELLDLDGLVQGVIDALRHRIDALGVTIECAAGLPSITSDRLGIEQILSNVIENAVKYLQPDRAGLIQVSGKVALGRAMIEIADNGRGIEPRDHERIFDLFRRSGAQDQAGEGIGLAHVRALAYRLGGTISVRSELGQGSTFAINLPLRFAGETGAVK